MSDVFAAHRRRWLIAAKTAMLAACAGMAALSLAACAASIFPFIPDHYTFSRQQVQAAVDRKFPYQRQLAQVFDITLSNPVLALQTDANRVSISLDAVLGSPFLGHPVNAVFTLSSQLAYDAARHSVVLHSPTVEHVDVGRLAGDYGEQINAAAAVLVTQLLDNYPIYTFKPEQLSFAGVNYEPGTITILSNGVRVQIVEH
jgi:hypothetical protein